MKEKKLVLVTTCKKKSVIISTRTTVHPCIEVSAIKTFQTFPEVYTIKTNTPGCAEITNFYF